MNKSISTTDYPTLEEQISALIEHARHKVVSHINTTMCQTYFVIGMHIVEFEQQGKDRALYGKRVLEQLSDSLSKKYGRGFSVDNLENMRRFYLCYQNSETLSRKSISIQQIVSAESTPIRQTLSDELPEFRLSWSHYLKLMRINNPDERAFYEIEIAKNNWSLREFQRQYDSSLYERLALSLDKEKVKQLSSKGQIIEKPADIIKDPYILEFTGLPVLPAYTENQLEQKLIDNLQSFLLELGRGFTFVGRQVRLSFEDQHFYVDLVFYNRLLRAFVLIDLKRGTLKHQDLGQMQMYVNYYDRFVKLDDENPSIGILLCADKNDSIVEITLPKDNNQIFASKYMTVLPSKEELLKLLNEKQE